MKKMKIFFCLMVVFVLITSTAWSAPRKVTFGPKNFAEKFAAAYQAGDIDKLLLMYAPSVEVGGKLLTRAQLRERLAKGLAKPGISIKGIIIVGGLDSFTEVSPGKFSGKIKFQITYEEDEGGPQAKSFVSDFPWGIVVHSDGGDWKIVKTDRLLYFGN